MIPRLENLARPLLMGLDPERAHEVTVAALERGLMRVAPVVAPPELAVEMFGNHLPCPVGVAAGFDKDARAFPGLLRLGFGFAEVGTLTPRPQAGNPKPRVFRLKADHAIINRFGFNNAGHAAALARLTAAAVPGCVGVNLGANKDSDDKVSDYVAGIEPFYDVACYFMVNVSSPNTPGLRDLQAPGEIDRLLTAVIAERDRCGETAGRAVPVAIKLAPDIAEDDLDPILQRILARDVAAIAISNTTIARPPTLASDARLAAETGGLSGPPVFEPSTRMLARAYRIADGRVPFIGIGGIDSGVRALQKIEAGASLVQLYTGLVYRGPDLLREIVATLTTAVEADSAAHQVSDLVGTRSASWQ